MRLVYIQFKKFLSELYDSYQSFHILRNCTFTSSPSNIQSILLNESSNKVFGSRENVETAIAYSVERSEKKTPEATNHYVNIRKPFSRVIKENTEPLSSVCKDIVIIRLIKKTTCKNELR